MERWDHEREIDDALTAQLGELGFFGMAVPESNGGMGLEQRAIVAVLEELAWGEPAVALTLAIQAQVTALLATHGTEAQQSAWLDRLAAGDAIACVAHAEDAGDDDAAITTTARRAGDAWVLNGTKRWVTNAARAGVAVVTARTDDGSMGLFLVDMQSSGVEVQGRDDTLGLRALPINTLALRDCSVSADALVGGSAEASAQQQALGSTMQLYIAAIAVGIAAAATEHAIAYADVREQFGTKLRAFEGIQAKLADMVTTTAAARALLGVAAGAGDEQQAAMAKLFATDTAMAVTTQAVQVYGGYGYMRDYPVEKTMRDAKAMQILGGANERLRVAVAESLYHG